MSSNSYELLLFLYVSAMDSGPVSLYVKRLILKFILIKKVEEKKKTQRQYMTQSKEILMNFGH